MIRVLIEVEAGFSERHRYNERTLEHLETRRIARPYPYSYGFVIGTIAADRDSVDCFIITTDRLKAGTVVECEPVGLLLQVENDEADHKVLAAIPGQDVVLGEALLHELQNFIYTVFAAFPDVRVRVGPILSRSAALRHLQAARPT